MEYWSIAASRFSPGTVARGREVPQRTRHPAVAALWRVWCGSDGLPDAGAYRAALPRGHGDHVTLLRSVGAEGEDFEFRHYGTGVRRLSGIDPFGVRVSDAPAPFREAFADLYADVLRTRDPAYCVHEAADAPLVRSWQRAVFPAAVDGGPGLFVWLIPLEYRLVVLETLMNGTADGMGSWRPVRDAAGAVEDFQCLFANDALCRAADLPPGMLTGRLLFRSYPQVRRTAFGRALAEAADGADGVARSAASSSSRTRRRAGTAAWSPRSGARCWRSRPT